MAAPLFTGVRHPSFVACHRCDPLTRPLLTAALTARLAHIGQHTHSVCLQARTMSDKEEWAAVRLKEEGRRLTRCGPAAATHRERMSRDLDSRS